jgi:hypothetical protein
LVPVAKLVDAIVRGEPLRRPEFQLVPFAFRRAPLARITSGE